MFGSRRTVHVMGVVADALSDSIKNGAIDLGMLQRWVEHFKTWRPTSRPADGVQASGEIADLYNRICRQEKLLVVSNDRQIKCF